MNATNTIPTVSTNHDSCGKATKQNKEPYYILLCRPSYEHVVAQHLFSTYGAQVVATREVKSTKRDEREAEAEVKSLLSGYVFARFPECHDNPCGRLPTQDELARCVSGTPRFLTVFSHEEKREDPELRFYNSESPENDELLASLRRERPVAVYTPITLPADVVEGLYETLSNKAVQNTRTVAQMLIDRLISARIVVPRGPLAGAHAKVRKIIENVNHLDDSVCICFLVDSGVLTGTKVTFRLEELKYAY